KESRAERHQVVNAFAFARDYENFVGDDGDRLGMVELEPLGAAFAREFGGGKNCEVFKLGCGEPHCNPPHIANNRRCARACREAAASTQGMKLSISASGGTGADKSAIAGRGAASTACASTAPMRPSRTAAAISPDAVE